MYEKHPSEELSSYIIFCVVISGRTFGRNMSIASNGISKKKTYQITISINISNIELQVHHERKTMNYWYVLVFIFGHGLNSLALIRR